jgi:hypothetical protein
LYREAHISACSNKQRREYDYRRDTNDYINYHRYNTYDEPEDRDQRMDRFHAEIGYRPYVLGFNACYRTNDAFMRTQFLYDESLYIRRGEGVRGRIAKVASNFRQASGPTESAQALPTAYSEYAGLRTIIVPYRKTAGYRTCQTFSVTVPKNAMQTDVMIVNADDAFAYEREQDPQSSWHINWMR